MSVADANLEICCKYNHCIFRLQEKMKKMTKRAKKANPTYLYIAKKFFSNWEFFRWKNTVRLSLS